MRFGGNVRITEASCIPTDSGIKVDAHCLVNGNALLLCQAFDQVKKDLARGCHAWADVTLCAVSVILFMVVDHYVYALAKKVGKRSHLCTGCRIDGDDAYRLKISKYRIDKDTLLGAVHQELQIVGNLVLTDTASGRAKLFEHVAKSKRRANGIGIGIAVKNDECISGSLQKRDQLIQIGQKLAHTSSSSSSSSSGLISRVLRMDAMCAP